MTKEILIRHENALLNAMQTSNLALLDDLLHDRLLFSIPNGDVITKEMDLESYRTNKMVLTRFTVHQQDIELFEDTAVVSVLIQLEGSFFDQPFNAQFRTIRVWKSFEHHWKVIGGSTIQV